ncbi:hypothetical protein CSB99_5793 (plasmid) [Klebsiella pneumoniae]|uniref:Uncharacterized protein n=10 Tax=Enterobacterales TaxID=91347 RepID=A0A0F6QC07_ECOLX|nr:conserved hypothetical protein [Klebsiella pneumoniae]AGH18561.1 hypothetical protein pCFNDM-CN_0047 [Citrobacter freundii]AHN60561.1 hypothetical protein pCRE727_47 [Enterobacter cloacae]AKD43352.1 hypothetical protein [Escherichia coli]AVX50384.1 hypothetical protein [Raoultella ornithinolytica]AWH58084.1 hypothetical protein [Enterobacter asburiae]AWH58128.1 hypothetical protein [Kluyvera intermedia]AWH58213.1 hypothetical protein [Klebsiella oxytoca]QBQ84856.1 hypothetical protein [M
MASETSFCGVCPILHRSELPPHINCASASIEMQKMKGYRGCDLVRLRPETTDSRLTWAEINSLREWPGRGRERCFTEYTKKAPPVNGRASAIQEREFYSASGVSPSMPCRASWSQRRRLLILSRFARLGLFPLLPLSILQTLNPASLVQCNTISPLLLNPSENRTAPRLCSALIKSKNSCFFIAPPVFLSVLLFLSFPGLF